MYVVSYLLALHNIQELPFLTIGSAAPCCAPPPPIHEAAGFLEQSLQTSVGSELILACLSSQIISTAVQSALGMHSFTRQNCRRATGAVSCTSKWRHLTASEQSTAKVSCSCLFPPPRHLKQHHSWFTAMQTQFSSVEFYFYGLLRVPIDTSYNDPALFLSLALSLAWQMLRWF